MKPHEIVVFLGPSLPVTDARRVLEARYLGPARCGDVLRVRRLRPRIIAIVDGLFETTAAPWHKEILLALGDGVAVYGAASMGALRAAELAPFGMVGVGKIFEGYRDGVYVDDDEVAVVHGAAPADYRVLSDAMVNIRATVARAVECGAIGTGDAGRLLDTARATFYQERSLTAAIKLAWADPCAERERFERFLDHGGYVDQKRLDTLALLHRLATAASPRRATPPARVERTTFLARLHRDVMSRPFVTAGAPLPIEERVALEARLLGPTYRLLRRLAQLWSIAEALARGRGFSPTARTCDLALNLGIGTRRWARANGLDAAAHRRFMERVAILGAVLERTEGVHAEQIDSDRLALLRIDGRYPYYRRTGLRSRQRTERAVLQCLDASGGDEGRLYRLTARLWSFVDDAAREIGLAPTEDLQEVADDFRRARGLTNATQTRGWLDANDLDRRGFAALALDDARLSLVLDGSATSALRLHESFEPVSWLVDAIRVIGLYPELARRATVGAVAQQPAILDSAYLLRDHCARVDEPVPADVERYARTLDFPGGEPELVAALGANGDVPDTLRLAPTGPRRERADWPEMGAWRFLVRSCCRDTDGRPLAERNLHGAAPHPPAELRSCPYAGSRLHHARPMNASALRALAEHWPDVIRAAAYLRRLHVERFPRTGDGLLDAYWIAATLASVPSYLIRRATDPVGERAVPSPVANLYKASLGASGMAYSMCVSRWSGARGSWAATAKAIHEYAERSGALIGEAEVCAGPPELIRRFLEILTSGDDAEAARGAWIRDLLPAPDRCLEYGTALLKMSLVRQLGAVRHLILLDLLGSRLARSSPAMAARLAAWRWRTEPWASLDRSADHEVTRWIAGQDSRTREKIITGIKDFVGRLDAGGASRVPPAFFRIVLPRRQRGVLAAIHAHQVDLTQLQQQALDGIATEQAAALGRADEVVAGVRQPGVAAEEFLRQEIS